MAQKQQQNVTGSSSEQIQPGHTSEEIGQQRGQQDLRPGEEGKLNVVEEQLEIGKRAVEKGGVRVRRTVEERPVEEQINLREEHVRVERRPVDRPITDADEQAFVEGEIEVTETAEQAVVAKTARVVEEVVVGKDIEQRNETIRDTVRRSNVEVEQIGATGASSTGTSSSRFEDFDADFRQNFQSSAHAQSHQYDQIQPAYRYGYGLASGGGATGKDWSSVEADAQSRWESKNPGTWERIKDSVRYAYDKARSKVNG